jgi:site-specific recombinase XerD
MGRKQARRVRGIFEKVPRSGIWWIRYSDATGRIRREKAGLKQTAETLYRKRKTEVLQGKKLPETRRRVVSFEELARDALAYSKAHKRSYDDDLSRMERLKSWFGTRQADGIAPGEMERRLTEAAQEGKWAPATANRYRALLSLTYRLGIRNGKVSANPARLVRHRQENNARIRWLTIEEEGKLRKVLEAKHGEHVPEFDLALNTGLRLSEMYWLTWDNVDLERRMLTVPRSKHGEKRHVPLNNAARGALGRLRPRDEATGWVFLNAQRERLTGPRYWFEPALRDARIQNFHWHDLRHSFASRLRMAGVDLGTIQELMGHKSIQMTMRYAHLAPTYQLAAVERLTDVSRAVAADPPGSRTESPTDTRTSTTAFESVPEQAEPATQPVIM